MATAAETGPLPDPEIDAVPAFPRMRAVGEWTEFAGRSVKGLIGTPRYMSEVLRQTATIIRGTSFLMVAINAFMGLTVLSVGYFILQSVGAADYIGLINGYAIPRQTGTTVFGYVLAAKVCCGITAEIGAMKIQQEIDALEMTGVDALRYVVGTRLGAIILFAPIGCALALGGQLLGGLISSTFVLKSVSIATLMDVTWDQMSALTTFYAFVTMLAISVGCVITACFFGLRATGGPAGVGAAVAQSLLVNLVLVHVIAGGLAICFYGADIGLPIGG